MLDSDSENDQVTPGADHGDIRVTTRGSPRRTSVGRRAQGWDAGPTWRTLAYVVLIILLLAMVAVSAYDILDFFMRERHQNRDLIKLPPPPPPLHIGPGAKRSEP